MITGKIIEGPTTVAFVLDGVVEKIMTVPEAMANVLLTEYTFVDETEEKRALTDNKYPHMYYFSLNVGEDVTMPVASDEGLYTMLLSNPVIAVISEPDTVQVGWKYDAINGFSNN